MLQQFRNLTSGVLAPNAIRSSTTNVTSTRFAFQCSLSSIAMHCRLQMVSRFDKALFVLLSVASNTLIVAFVQNKRIVLSKSNLNN